MYVLIAPTTPGAIPTEQARGTLIECRKAARDFRARRDLSHQDVRIDNLGGVRDGTLVEYAGPCR